VILNAANEVAVKSFLEDKIRFVEIAERVESALSDFASREVSSLEDVIALDLEVKRQTADEIEAKQPSRSIGGA
jgi:1-deoxy-D-xylulose-5-phosphate reductoisomerase